MTTTRATDDSIANGALGKRSSFARVHEVIDLPDLLDVQLSAYQDFLQTDVSAEERKPVGLQAGFIANFPISDAREIFTLEFIDYRNERPKYNVDECRDRELTYAVPLKARLRLSSKADRESDDFIETIEQEVYLGNIPILHLAVWVSAFPA